MGIDSDLSSDLPSDLSSDLSGGGFSPASILGSLIVEWWDARLGVVQSAGTVVSWTGQSRGLVVKADGVPQQPTFATDAANFKGRPVIKTALPGGGEFLIERDFGFDLHAAGARPYVAGVLRHRGSPDGAMWTHVDAAPRVYSVGNGDCGGSQYRSRWEGNNAVQAFDTTIHFFEWWLTAAGVASLSIDGAAPSTAGTGLSLSEAVRGLSIGNDQVAFIGNCNMAAHIEARSAPSAAQRALLRTWAQINWGTP